MVNSTPTVPYSSFFKSDQTTNRLHSTDKNCPEKLELKNGLEDPIIDYFLYKLALSYTI